MFNFKSKIKESFTYFTTKYNFIKSSNLRAVLREKKIKKVTQLLILLSIKTYIIYILPIIIE